MTSDRFYLGRLPSFDDAHARGPGSDPGPSHPFLRGSEDAGLMPALRQISAMGVPARPVFRMNAFCASVNFNAFVRFVSSPRQERTAEDSSCKRSSFQEAEQART